MIEKHFKDKKRYISGINIKDSKKVSLIFSHPGIRIYAEDAF